MKVIIMVDDFDLPLYYIIRKIILNDNKVENLEKLNKY